MNYSFEFCQELKSLCKAVGVCLGMLVVINTFYLFMSALITPIWISVVISNVVIALAVLVFYWKKIIRVFSFRHLKFTAFLPGVILLSASFGLAFVTRSFLPGVIPTNLTSFTEYSYLAFLSVTLIPVIEEIIFRFYLTGLLRRFVSSLLAAYISVIAFAAAHSFPVSEPRDFVLLSVPIGPLLLGSICEWLYLHYNRLVYAIWFHACANFTALVFMAVDKRWLDWLKFLYLS